MFKHYLMDHEFESFSPEWQTCASTGVVYLEAS